MGRWWQVLIAIAVSIPPAAAAPADKNIARQRKMDGFYRRFVGCVIRGNRSLARTVALTPLETGEGKTAFMRMFPERSNCIGVAANAPPEFAFRLQVSEPLLRGYVAQLLYLDEYSTGLPANLAAPTVQPSLPSSTQEAVFRCIASAGSLAADRLLRTAAASSEETATLGTLRPTITACLSPDDAIAMTRSFLRGQLAIALYGLAGPAAVPR